MLRGVAVDLQRKARASIELDASAKAHEDLLDILLPHDVYTRPPKVAPWYRSPTQLMFIFYDLLGMPEQFTRATKNKVRTRTTGDEALEALILLEPLYNLLLTTLQQYRSLSAFKKFTDMTLRPDGRMHTSFSPTAETFRWTSSKDAWGYGGNLQNLPEGAEE